MDWDTNKSLVKQKVGAGGVQTNRYPVRKLSDHPLSDTLEIRQLRVTKRKHINGECVNMEQRRDRLAAAYVLP